MKPVNLKTTMKLYAEMQKAEENRKYQFRLLVDAQAHNPDSELAEYRKQQYDAAVIKANDATASLLLERGCVALQLWLGEIQKRSRTRTIVVMDILNYLARVEAELDIPKTAMEEVSVTVDRNSQNFPSAYHGIPESTLFHAVFRNGSWRIDDIFRGRTRRANQRIFVNHTETSKKALVNKYTTFYA